MVLLIASSAQVLSSIGIERDSSAEDHRCLSDLSTCSSLTRTRGRPSRPGRVHSTFPLKSTTAAAMNLDAADRFNYQFSAPSAIFQGSEGGPNTLNVDVDDEFLLASCNLFLRKRRAKISTS